MKYRPMGSATMHTSLATSCATLDKRNQYAVQSCVKCKTGTLELFRDSVTQDTYARCLNCGKEYFPRNPLAFL